MLVTRETWRCGGQPYRARSASIQLRGSIFPGTPWVYPWYRYHHLSASTTWSKTEASVCSPPVSGLPSYWKEENKKEQIGQIDPIVLRVSIWGKETQIHCKNNNVRKLGACLPHVLPATEVASPSTDSCSPPMPGGKERPQGDPNQGWEAQSTLCCCISTDFPWNLIYVEIHIHQLIFNIALLKFMTLFLTYSQVQSVLIWPSNQRKKKKKSVCTFQCGKECVLWAR